MVLFPVIIYLELKKETGDKQSNGKHWISLFIAVKLLTRYSEYSLVIPLYVDFMVFFL